MAFQWVYPSLYLPSLLMTTVINGVISLPIAVLAYFFLPDVPGNAKPNWLFSERVSTAILFLLGNQGFILISSICTCRKSSLRKREWQEPAELLRGHHIRLKLFSVT